MSGARPETIAKYEKARELIAAGEVKYKALKEVGLGDDTFNKIRRQKGETVPEMRKRKYTKSKILPLAKKRYLEIPLQEPIENKIAVIVIPASKLKSVLESL